MPKLLNISLPSYKKIVFFLAPLVFMLIPICMPGQESTCAFIIFLTASYWVSECLPLGATGMIPIVLFSLTGILTLKEVTESFFISAIWLFFGIYMLAIGVQRSKLHIRIALKILLIIGTSPKRLLLGFMLTAHILSMFIANIPVTAMLLPIAEGLMQKLKHNIASAQIREEEEVELQEMNGNEVQVLMTNGGESINSFRATSDKNEDTNSVQNIQIEDDDTKKQFENLSRAITLAIPYSSTIGGVCTLTGSVPNLIAVILIHQSFPRSEQISFGTWFLYCTPGACLVLIITYVWILWLYIGFRKTTKRKSFDEKKVKELLQIQYNELGSMTWEQGWILFLFISTAVLWFTRKPGFMKGWSSLIPHDCITDGTVSLVAGLLLFMLPQKKPTFNSCKGQKNQKDDNRILTFHDFQTKFCWEVMFIAGGGLVLSAGAQASGLSDVVSRQLEVLGSLPPWAIVVTLTVFTSLLTECVSGMAITTLMVPILAKLATSTHIHPYYLCVPMFLSTMIAFMLPVATPPNAIAYSTGLISMKDMLKTGWMINVIAVFVINLSINTYGKTLLNLDQFPAWADTNGTATQSILL